MASCGPQPRARHQLDRHPRAPRERVRPQVLRHAASVIPRCRSTEHGFRAPDGDRTFPLRPPSYEDLRLHLFPQHNHNPASCIPQQIPSSPSPSPPYARACGPFRWDCAQGVWGRGHRARSGGRITGGRVPLLAAYTAHLLAEETYRIAVVDAHLVVPATNAQRDDVFTYHPHASAAPEPHDAYAIAAASTYTPHAFAGDAHLIPATNPHLVAHDAHALAADAQRDNVFTYNPRSFAAMDAHTQPYYPYALAGTDPHDAHAFTTATSAQHDSRFADPQVYDVHAFAAADAQRDNLSVYSPPASAAITEHDPHTYAAADAHHENGIAYSPHAFASMRAQRTRVPSGAAAGASAGAWGDNYDGAGYPRIIVATAADAGHPHPIMSHANSPAVGYGVSEGADTIWDGGGGEGAGYPRVLVADGQYASGEEAEYVEYTDEDMDAGIDASFAVRGDDERYATT
ncbi:hypothetical protein DFH09DRAFT_1379015 [Mycena vulgaris]|nr:hypothetical protein DFH09DRAFT_1379015 [Mycena vulgaris]